MSDERKEVPATACQFAGGEVMTLAAAAAAPAEPGKPRPIRMLARSAQPIEHWWWGRVVHDMAGMKLHKDKIPVDYEHYEPIGYLDKFDASNKGLFVDGALVPTSRPNDRTLQLLELSDGGVPFEASIDFGGDGIKTEWLGEDQVAEVNGYTFEGPGCIIREWPLRGVAVCPYGADMRTESAFRKTTESFTLHHVEEPDMATNPTKKLSDATVTDPAAAPAATPAAAPAVETPAAEPKAEDVKPAVETPAATPAAPAAELSADRVECKRFVDAFGAEGGTWFAEGLTFEQAQVRFTKKLRETNEQLAAHNAELSKKLGLAQGEQAPVGFDGGDTKKRGGFASKLRFAGQAPK